MVEGLGINNGRQVVYNLILLIPFFLYIPNFISKNDNKILAPLNISIAFSVFFIFSFISAIFSKNLQNSFEQLFSYLALFLIFTFAYNNKDLLRNIVISLIFVLAFVFSVFSLFASFFINQNSLFSIPINISDYGYQFVYSAFGSHNNLGDFLLLPLIVLFLWSLGGKEKLRNFLVFLFFIPYFIFAYSRSAYLDLILIVLFTVFYIFRKHIRFINRKIIGFSFIVVVILALFIFVIPSDTKKPTILNSFYSTLQQRFNLGPNKLFFAFRNKYATEGLFSLSANPLLGVGPGNFYYASVKYTDTPNQYTSVTSHNLLFDIFVENGIPAGIVFLLILMMVTSNIDKQLFKGEAMALNNTNLVLSFIFLAMLLNFQTHYAFLIHSFFMLFFIILGIIYHEKRTIRLKGIFIILPIILLVVVNVITISNFFLNNKEFELALSIYPLNRSAYEPLINQKIQKGDAVNAERLLQQYARLFNGDKEVMQYTGDVYYNKNNKLSLFYYEKSFEENNFADLPVVKKIYTLKIDLEGESTARNFINKFFSKIASIENKNITDFSYRLSVFNYCRELYIRCPYSI